MKADKMEKINVLEFLLLQKLNLIDVKEFESMATLGKSNNTNFLPKGNTPKLGIITPKSKVIAEKTDIPTNENTDPSHS